MPYGICHLSIVPVRALAEDASEMHTQLLYGDHFKVLEKRKKWSKIKIAYDGCIGWISNNQYLPVEKETYKKINSADGPKFAAEMVSFAQTGNNILQPVLLGSSVEHVALLSHSFEGEISSNTGKKSNIIATAVLYLNAPYLWGGKTPFGIDCSGLTQMCYKINGHALKRNAAEQATQGEALSFIEESEPGDLAFFDNKDGTIVHVGIIMKDNYIIHAHGKVRIDRLDHTGIFNSELRNYTHSLRVIKKII